MPEPAQTSPDRRDPLEWLALALALIATFASGLRALRIVAINPQSDEGLYRAYMKRLDSNGLTSFPELFTEAAGIASGDSHETPYRVGHILLTWVAAKLCGPSFETLTYVSFACQVLLVLAVWRLGRALWGGRVAAFTALAMACSPLLLRLAPQPLTDTPALLGSALALLTFWELLERPRRGALIAFVASFTFALSVKELSVLLAAPFLALWALQRFSGRTQLRVSDMIVALVAPGVLCLGLWMLAAWDTSAALRYVWTGLKSTGANEYMRTEAIGPWYRYLVEMLLLSPLPALLAAAAVGWTLLAPRDTDRDRSLVAWICFGAVLLAVAAPLPKNIRFFAILELPLRALEVAALTRVAQLMLGGRSAAIGAWTLAALTALCALDLYAANVTFVHLHDTVISHMLRMRGFLP